MKKMLSLVGLLSLVLLFTQCEDIIPNSPNVTYEAINDGATLRLSWTQVTDADGYKIYLDGALKTTLGTSATSYDVSDACQTIEVKSYTGTSESDAWELDLTPVISTISVYGMSDPDTLHQSGFGFASDGSAILYSVTNQASSIDFYMDDRSPLTSMNIRGASDPGGPVTNTTKENAISNQTGVDFDAIDTALAPGNYATRRQISTSAVYGLWVDRGVAQFGWDKTDNFAKIKITAVTGAKVDVKIAYQKVGGIRWLITP